MSSGPWDSFGEEDSKSKVKFNNSPNLFFYGPKKWQIALAFIILIILWLGSGLYIVSPREEGVKLRFGKYVSSTEPGLRYRLPYPIEQVLLVDVTSIHKEELGSSEPQNTYTSPGFMITGDENIVDINFEVQWQISNARKYLFNIRDSQKGESIKEAAESAMREAVGRNKMHYLIEGNGRAMLSQETKRILQNTIDEYDAGISILSVQLKRTDPPVKVVPAFRDVQTARADRSSLVNVAQAYANEIIPRAKGEAEQKIRRAEAQKATIVNLAEGEVSMFKQIMEEYKKGKYITKNRIYLETMEKVLLNSETIILGERRNGGPLPVLSLDFNNDIQKSNMNRREYK